jgi:predicted nucleic acid-binding protein
MVVVSDTSPVNYLVLVGQVEVLPALFGEVVIPRKVEEELTAVGSPAVVRRLVGSDPSWLLVRDVAVVDPELARLDRGEAEAISLAAELKAGLLLCDERRGRVAAESRAIRVTGTLGVLEQAALRGLIDLRAVVDRLVRETNFRVGPKVLAELLRAERGGP